MKRSIVKGQLRDSNIIDEYKVILMDPMDHAIVIGIARNMAEKAGFKLTDEVMIATAASELSTNILRYADKGEMLVRIIQEPSRNTKGIELVAKDQGPGIHDLELALKEHYTSTENSLGLGLLSVYNYMDEFHIETEGKKGTCVKTRKWC